MQLKAKTGARKMARRKMPARYKSGPKKGQFKPKGRRNAPRKKTKKRARRNGTKAGQMRKTSRRAYRPKRKGRRNSPGVNGKAMTSVITYAAVVAIGGSYVKRYLAQATGSPMAANYGSVAAIGALGYWLTKKAKTRPGGYAVLGVAFAHLAEELGKATGLFETGGGFMPKSQVVRRLPRRVNIQRTNPVANIYVPS
jgi:hypothetical protein